MSRNWEEDNLRFKRAYKLLKVLRQCKKLATGRMIKITMKPAISQNSKKIHKNKVNKETKVRNSMRKNKYAQELAWSLGVDYRVMTMFLVSAYRYLTDLLYTTNE